MTDGRRHESHADRPTANASMTGSAGAVRFFDISAQEAMRPGPGEVPRRDGILVNALRPATGHGRAPLSAGRFDAEIWRELHRARLAKRHGMLAAIGIAELEQLHRRLGPRAEAALSVAFDELLALNAPALEEHTPHADGGFVLLMPETTLSAGLARLQELSHLIDRTTFDVGGEQIRVTPVIGYAVFPGADTAQEVRDQADAALQVAHLHLDLLPVGYAPEMRQPATPSLPTREFMQSFLTPRVRDTLQTAFTLALLVLMPFLIYVLVWYVGYDLTTITYPLVAFALAATAGGLWIEGFRAMGSVDVPATPSTRPPPASAIIPAYLPNEAATILSTVITMLEQDYPGGLQVILAYNTPQHLPVEDTLAELAAQDPRLLLLRVSGSTSKAQNVNAALTYVKGDFVGIFDADHHPEQGSFMRAWRWLADGHDIVQGHCVVRNGDASRIARTIAVEFETIYAVSHPGRARLHGFGIFGGSNGYWRTDALRRIRMQGSMLTEDIDSSMRSLLNGFKIVSDPGLISSELAPTTLGALWHQRLRWAQGWTQTSRRHLGSAMRSDRLTARQKAGAAFLLGWTQIVPWVTIQVVPVLAFTAWRDRGFGQVDLLVPLFVLLSIFTFSVGPAQAVFAYALGNERIRRQGSWFWLYGLNSVLWFGEFKNLLSRVAQVKELVGERQWRVTPRAVDHARTSEGSATDRTDGAGVIDVRTPHERAG